MSKTIHHDKDTDTITHVEVRVVTYPATLTFQTLLDHVEIRKYNDGLPHYATCRISEYESFSENILPEWNEEMRDYIFRRLASDVMRQMRIDGYTVKEI